MWRSVYSVAIGWLVLSGATVQAQTSIPKNWSKMEIEAKWDIDARKYDELVSSFADGTERYGYTFNVRWRGVSRKFIDVYYDNAAKQLSRALHSLRHRTRFRSNPLASDNSVGSLNSAAWQQDWQRVQYKSTPCHIGAIWFRVESGNCRIQDARDRDLCLAGRQLNIVSVLSGHVPSHTALKSLGNDHSDFVLTTLQPILHVFDYRYRVLFEKNGEAAFELSLDRVLTTNLQKGGTKNTYEAELEIVSDNRTINDVKNLMALAKTIESEFQLKPSTTSKGGISVNVCK